MQQLFGDYAANVRIQGERFEVSDNHTALISVSPDVTATFSSEVAKVQGRVKLPTAQIRVNSVPQSSAQVSQDQVIVDSERTPTDSETTEVFANLRLELGDDVRFDGLGLTAQFSGGLQLTEEPSQATLAKGEITIVEGQYEAYGQDLSVQDGKLIWVGGRLDDPGIDIIATRQPKPDITVGVRARGTLAKPTVSLTSTPTMAQSDQLAYLILGRPMESSSASESSYLSKAALALGMRGGNYLTERYGSKLGVDQISIETTPGETTDQAALVVGKYLSPRLYVSYGLGLLESISTLRLEYTLNKHWSLKTESSAEQSGGDLRYVIEVD